MKRTRMVIAAAATGVMAAGAYAGPSPAAKGKLPASAQRVARFVPTAGTGSADGPTFSDNFDTYAAGSNIAGQGAWEVWYTGGTNAPVDNAQAASAPNSLRLLPTSDIVQRFTIDSGKWLFKIKTYVPSTMTPGSGGFIIMLNQYGGPDNWSLQVALNDITGSQQALPFMIESQFDNAIMPLVTDQWVEFRAEIDLDVDQVTNFYNNQMLGTPHLWTDNNFASGPGITSIAALDLYSDDGTPIYFDDVSLEPDGCYPDCNNSGNLTIADFICFQGQFVAGNLAYADCNNSGSLTIADFICFQGAFVAGCP